jgi:hypothetical protein
MVESGGDVHPKSTQGDMTMKTLFDRIDHILEERYGGTWDLRSNRPARGQTSNPEADWLFNIGAAFIPGYGSQHGRGYLGEIILATAQPVDPGQREEIEQSVLELLWQYLPEYFPGKQLEVVRDGAMYKIRGDLSLGMV